MVYLGSGLHGPASTAAANSRASQRHFCATLLFTRRASNGDMPIVEFFLHYNIEQQMCWLYGHIIFISSIRSMLIGVKPLSICGWFNQVNLWIGSAGTVTALHYDLDDNFLVQVAGYKYLGLFLQLPMCAKWLFLIISSCTAVRESQQMLSVMIIMSDVTTRTHRCEGLQHLSLANCRLHGV